ncbi:AI-2E family transporter [Pectobacteriaceae bacterium CE90]|nr:AI-2E family transporter [Prodigiosinella sp. LS101]WJV54619.1 AI-2E family transporter [Prodigiosinella sp. LS101]WJV58981.1 AI-2E family transporter [Pectobacteriaceae bacterium C111]WJY14373.1 AI-2E family transporter [Pectobacteriaceae bacterium CE90]
MQLLNLRQARLLSIGFIMSGLLLLIVLRLLACFVAGFLVYEIINLLTPYFQKVISGKRARLVVVAVISTVVVSLLCVVFGTLVGLLMQEMKDTSVFNERIAFILHDVQKQFMTYLPGYLPVSIDELQREFLSWLQKHVVILQNLGKDFLHGFVTMLIGMILGAIISLYNVEPDVEKPLLKTELLHRVALLSASFRNIVFAQVKISLVNTTLSAVFILGIFPGFGVHLPFAKTLVILTFIFGLLPVIGNLISNSVVFIAALSISVPVSLVALVYLMLIHKLEYFLNAKIVGTRIKAHAWEILLAMLVFEAAFGISGVIAAPIYYAYLKSELKEAALI